MDSSLKEFHREEIDGKRYFVFDLDNKDVSFSTLFVCPNARLLATHKRHKDQALEKTSLLVLDSSPYFNGSIEDLDSPIDNYYRLKHMYNHFVLPLFWCSNNKENDDERTCDTCSGNSKIGSDYYKCLVCDQMYHKECVEAPIEIKHSSHPTHSLKLGCSGKNMECVYCGKPEGMLAYRCTLCNLVIDPVCALKPTPFVIEKPKRHDHSLTFFTRKAPVDCNVCGLINQSHSTYICLDCDFVAHYDCANFPNVIRISRHNHRISYTSSLTSGKSSCGVCRKDVDSEYGGYTCKKCDGYVVHSRCALRKDIWDGKELEGVPEDDDIEELLDPFERISDGIILHFAHPHCLKLEINEGVYDGNKTCDACLHPIYKGDFYSCMECDFILHETCANAPHKIRHPLYPHPLTLKVMDINCDDRGSFKCTICERLGFEFRYEYKTEWSIFVLDMRCASILEPYNYQGHEHPLYLALDPQEDHCCKVCESSCQNLLNCIECNFITCMECVTLPYMARYKHDKHFLTLDDKKEETTESDWCETCERLLFSEVNKDRRFYRCNQCCVTLHIDCLLGKDPYVKPGYTIKIMNNMEEAQILSNNSFSRPICNRCEKRCEDKLIFIAEDKIFCCRSCVTFEIS